MFIMSLTTTVVEFLDCLPTYLRMVKHNLKLQELLHQDYLRSKTMIFENTPKGRAKKRDIKLKYFSFNPYKIDVFELRPKGGYNYLFNYRVEGEEFYYRYFRPLFSITFEKFFKVIIRYVT